MRSAFRVYPGAVTRIDAEDLGGNRVYLPTITRLPGLLAHALTSIIWHQIEQALPVLNDESIKVNKRADGLRNAVGGTTDDASAVGVTAQDNFGEFLHLDKVHDIGDVDVEVDARRTQV